MDKDTKERLREIPGFMLREDGDKELQTPGYEGREALIQYLLSKVRKKDSEFDRDGKRRIPGMPMSEIWPGAREAVLESIAIAERSRHDQQLYGQCKPAY